MYGTSGQKQLRSHIRGTNVMLRYFDARYSPRIMLIRKCLCKAILSLLSGAGGGGREGGNACRDLTVFGEEVCV